MSENEAFHEQKRAVSVVVKLSTGQELAGVVHCRERSNEHHGRERVKDVLNGPSAMLPLLCDGIVRILQKSFIEQVALSELDLADPDDPDLTEHRTVEIVLSSGESLRGEIFVSTPPGKQRTLDFMNRGERFFYLDTPHGTRVIGLEHVVHATDRGTED